MKNVLLLPELKELLEAKDYDTIREFCESTNPVDVAEYISALEPEEIWEILLLLEPSTRAEIFSYIPEDIQLKVAEALNRKELSVLIADLPPDDRVDLFKNLNEDIQKSLLPALAQAERDDIVRLASYPEGSAGSVMTSEYATLSPELTVEEAIERLRNEAPDKETIYYAYVVDKDRKLIGYVTLKDLILARPTERIRDIMNTDVIYVNATVDKEDAARIIQKYDLLALPVVNDQGILVGIITNDDAFDIITQEQTEDMEKLMAIGGAHDTRNYLRVPAWEHFRRRAGWIVGLAAVGLISGSIIHSYEHLLTNLMILALYMPMMTDTGGNTGSQAATVVVRALALKEITPRDFLKVLFKELRISFLLAIVLGILSYAKVLFLSQGSEIPGGFTLSKIGFVISLALSIQVITATMIGAMLPMLAARFKADPAVVASPALTTIVDITGLVIYFNTARFLLGL